MNRTQHLEWAKARAREYLDDGDPKGALASFYSDMEKHDELKDHRALRDTTMLLLGGYLETVEAMRKAIEGFN